MRHRPLLAVSLSLAGLVALAPAFAAGPSSPQPAPGASASSTTATSAPGSGSSTPTSGPTTTTTMGSHHGKAPGTAPGAPEDDTGAGPSTGADDPAADDPGADDPAAEDPAADDSANANCAAPEQSEVPAPEVGASESFDVGDAGTVELERTSATDLHILAATPADGWDDKVATPAGPRVKGKFVNLENPEQAVRFAASLNSDGTVMRLKVTDCG